MIAFLPVTPPLIARLIASTCLFLLAACAQQPAQQETSAEPGSTMEQDDDDAPPRETAGAPRPAPNLPKQDLTEAVLYEYLLAEIAGQRGSAGLSAQAYADLAKRTRDPRIARRATEVALFARMPGAAIDAAKIWLETEPASLQALQSLTGLLVNTNRHEEALPYLQKLLAAEGNNTGDGFLQLTRLLANNKDKALTLRLVQQLAQSYPRLAQAHFAVAQAAATAEQPEVALAEVRAAARLKPDWELAALFEAQLLQRQSNDLALERLADYLRRYPNSKEARMNYARLLVSEKKYNEARVEFQILSRDFPDNIDVVYAVGVLSLQLQDYAPAEANFKRLLTLPYRDKNAVRLYLGQIAEDQKNYPEALRWYGEISSGDQVMQAQVRYAQVLAKQGKLGEARAYLRQISAGSDQARVQLLLAEAQMLREANQPKAAFDLLGGALEKLPDNPDLMYDYAMLAEKLERLDLLESNLKKLIVLRPDHAHAHNALGYSLADRNLRLPEAHTLIERALKLAPEDPFIIDSMGWVHYRLGNFKQALAYLRKAYDARPDAEIAAHLGEVLWVAGERGEAEKIWLDASKKTPDNDTLSGTIKRFK